MDWDDVIAHSEAKNELTEWRGRIGKSQKQQLEELERELKIPQAALVRMALKTFLPLTENRGYKKEGIRRYYDDQGKSHF